MDDARTHPTPHSLAPSSSTSVDAIPPFAARVVALFDDTLADVVFPGLDRAVLQNAHTEVARAHVALVEAQRLVAERETALASVSSSLVRLAERAVAYARVYADGEDDSALIAQLDGLGSHRSTHSTEAFTSEKPRGKKRGRPPAARLPLVENKGVMEPLDVASDEGTHTIDAKA